MSVVTPEERKYFITSGSRDTYLKTSSDNPNKNLIMKLVDHGMATVYGDICWLEQMGWDEIRKFSLQYNLLSIDLRHTIFPQSVIVRVMTEYLPEEYTKLQNNFSDDEWYLSYQESYSAMGSEPMSYFYVVVNFYNVETFERYNSIVDKTKLFNRDCGERTMFDIPRPQEKFVDFGRDI
jgi:hypothetical protein